MVSPPLRPLDAQTLIKGALLRRRGLGIRFDPKLPVRIEGEEKRVPVRDLPRKDHLRQPILDLPLHRPPQRARAVVGVVSQIEELLFGLGNGPQPDPP